MPILNFDCIDDDNLYISLGGVNTSHLEVSATLDNLHIPSSNLGVSPSQ